MTTVELPKTIYRPKPIRPCRPSRGSLKTEGERVPAFLLHFGKAASVPCSLKSGVETAFNLERLSNVPTEDDEDAGLRELVQVERELQGENCLIFPSLPLRAIRSEDALKHDEDFSTQTQGYSRKSYPQLSAFELVPPRPCNPMADDPFFVEERNDEYLANASKAQHIS